jgi:type IV pilus assembly protein PilB
LDIAEKRLPQDGRFKMQSSTKHAIDFRLSTCPTIQGEKMVLRLLDSAASLEMDKLGLNDLQKKIFLEHIQLSQGMILVTGPTGSGKTVSLYTALQERNTEQINISTVEDPIEMKLLGINQVQVHPKIGLTFQKVLRAFLRQDPDIIMIGEMRDKETAEIAIKAAQTGHLVFSTLHTNSACETLTRLFHMGIAAFQIASSVSLIVAQRLVRKLCDHCKKRDNQIYLAVGCENCHQGYRGRIALFELLIVTKNIQMAIIQGEHALEIQKKAQEEGMITLFQSALEKIQMGITSFAEVERVLGVQHE